MLICYIRLKCGWSFRLYHCITNICYFVASYLFLFWHSWFLWRCFVVLLQESQLLSKGFPFLAMSKISLVCCLKCSYSCFSSYFCFLVIVVLLSFVLSALYLVAVISLPLHFLSSLIVVVLMHQRYLQCWQVLSLLFFFFFFFDIYSLSTASLRCKVLCIIISIFVLCSICWSSSLVYNYYYYY